MALVNLVDMTGIFFFFLMNIFELRGDKEMWIYIYT